MRQEMLIVWSLSASLVSRSTSHEILMWFYQLVLSSHFRRLWTTRLVSCQVTTLRTGFRRSVVRTGLFVDRRFTLGASLFRLVVGAVFFMVRFQAALFTSKTFGVLYTTFSMSGLTAAIFTSRLPFVLWTSLLVTSGGAAAFFTVQSSKKTFILRTCFLMVCWSAFWTRFLFYMFWACASMRVAVNATELTNSLYVQGTQLFVWTSGSTLSATAKYSIVVWLASRA